MSEHDSDPDPGHPESAWRDRLAPAQYRILREGGTEVPGSSALLAVSDPGTFRCAGCDRPLFATARKYASGTGWPSFTAPVEADAVRERPDLGATEVLCAGCDGHLGHVFDDGPEPTGLRYCINGVALRFEAEA